jgi:predicted amidohydrolase YtcJ
MKRTHLFVGFIACLFLIFSCNQKKHVDTLFFNAHVYTINENNDTASAFAVANGKIVAVGNEAELLNKFEVKEKIDLEGQYVYPGFNDAHSHFYGLGQYMHTVDLTGTKSWSDVLERCKAFHQKNNGKYILGRGWDQNDWEDKEYPTNDELNTLFPNIPVVLKRVDGHAAIVNDTVLKLSALMYCGKMIGGELIRKNDKLTGVLIDNAVDRAENVIPKTSLSEKIKALKDAEKICFQHGLTTVCDAGLDKDIIDLIDSLQKAKELTIRVYAMISATDANLDYYLNQKPYKTDRLNVGSFKMYGDGSLGSRGACLLQPYSDMKDHSGFLLTQKNKIEEYIKRIAASPYQLCTHCIGDSANRFVLATYASYLKEKNDRRWRIEHAQVMHPSDYLYYKNYSIIPSVQPTHATSDMYWAKDRLGDERVKNAYAYKTLLQQNGWLPLGTDFPVESVNPLYTFYSAVARKDADGFPADGFQMENALTREEALRGITIWPAKADFEEKEKGTIEPNKFADFVVLDVDMMKDDLVKIRNTKPKATYVSGKKVY